VYISTNCIYFWKEHIVNTFWRKCYQHLRWGRIDTNEPIWLNMQCGLISGIKTCSEAVLWNKSERIVMSQRHPFSTVSCFRRFASRDKIFHYVLIKNKVCLKKCLKKFQIWQSSIVQINLSITSFKINTKISTSFRRSMLISFSRNLI
jgi:hypothetical protein